jgi:hypothetical protein
MAAVLLTLNPCRPCIAGGTRKESKMKQRNVRSNLMLAAISLIAYAVIVCAIHVTPAVAEDDGGRCKQVRARFMNTIVTEDCTSPVGLCTAGVLTGSRLLNGPNTFTAFGLAPSAGLPGIVPETTVSFAGERVMRTERGTLTLSAVGVFDTAPTAMGEFDELETVIGGTGRFAGATGTLHLFGRATADRSGFVGNIRGELCLSDKN